MQVAFAELDAADAQRERIAGGLFRLGLARWQLEQLSEVEAAVLGEQQLGPRLVQFDPVQVQGTAPQAVELQVGVQTLEADLLLARLADLQAPEGQFEAERVEFDPLQVRRHRGVIGQLLIGDTQGNPWENQKA
ncbi:hypothetical protein D3C84_738550 [compost metagenome]